MEWQPSSLEGLEVMFLQNFYKGKKIFLTGHTGFKGCWLGLFFKKLGAEVTGYALEAINHRGNLSQLINSSKNIHSTIADIRNFELLKETLKKSNPEIIFHLAAQPLVRDSYQDPITTYETNVMGTAYLLEITKDLPSIKAVINITTDKCYENRETNYSYQESDKLGGNDPYSASKASSEIVTASYRKSFYEKKNIGLATARAGNIIGGGDFAKDRIIPDIVESIQKKQHCIIRNPNAIRPWQYILDVLNGYLILAKKLYEKPKEYSESFNFSPQTEITVKEVVDNFVETIGEGNYQIKQEQTNLYESQILKLDSSKARQRLGWTPQYNTKETIKNTALWYKDFLQKKDVISLCESALTDFLATQN